MRPIDGDKLHSVLENIANHLLETKSEAKHGTAHVIEYAMEVVRAQPTIAPPPNDPLTLEELREMDGEPVWLKRNQSQYYDILKGITKSSNACFYTAELSLGDYGKTWLAYRRKPEDTP